MGVAERKVRHREQLRQEILDAAGELFAREGYEHISMRKIADKIEYSPTTIYLYFKDKDELLQQICNETFVKLLQALESAVAGGSADPLGSLRAGCRAYIQFGLEFPHHYRLTFVDPREHAEGKIEDFERSIGGRAFGFLEGAIQHCIDAGVIREMNAREAATSCWALLHGVVMLMLSGKPLVWIENQRLVDRSLDLMIGGLQA